MRPEAIQPCTKQAVTRDRGSCAPVVLRQVSASLDQPGRGHPRRRPEVRRPQRVDHRRASGSLPALRAHEAPRGDDVTTGGLLLWPASLDPLLTIDIAGDPASQGSLRTFRNGGMAYPESTVNHRNYVIDRLAEAWAGRSPIDGPVAVRAVFTFGRPTSHYLPKTLHRRARAVLRPDAPEWHAVKNRGDTDKLARLVGDALEISRVLDHDSLIVRWLAEKPYGETGSTHLEIYRPGKVPTE